MTLTLDNRFDIDLHAVQRVAWRGERVELSSNAIARMAAARRNFMNLIERPDAVVYGVTTGYGQNARNRLSSAERLQHASRPPNAAAASWGEPFPDRIIRAVILARLANFLDGYSAVSPEVAQAVVAMLSAKSLPAVPSRGHGGAGEILALSHLFHDLASTHPMAEKDVLCLINGSPVASALVADAALAGRNRLELTASVFALAVEGFNVPLSHFAEELDTLWNNDHDAWALRFLRSLLATADDGGRRPYQAPVSFRILPRMLGLARRAVHSASEIAQESLSAVTDNPVILPPSGKYPVGMAISTGGYQNPYAVMAMDQVTSACANLCVIAGRMAAKLLDGTVSLLPPQLDDGDGTAYMGCLPMAITGYEEEARTLAQATLLPGSESGGFGQNDVASPTPLAWRKQERAGILLEASLAALAPIALRALDVTRRPVPPKLSTLVRVVRQCVPSGSGVSYGEPTAKLAERFRAVIYGTSEPF